MIRRLLPLLAFMALASLLWVGVRMNSGRDNTAIPSPLLGKPAPHFALPVFGDASRHVTDHDLLGKPYLLNVWGSWCVNCAQEHAQVTALAQSGQVRVIGYNYKDAPGDAHRWLQTMGNPYALILADEDGSAALDWGIYGAPETYLVDAKGIIRWKTIGPISAQLVHDELQPRLARLQGAQ